MIRFTQIPKVPWDTTFYRKLSSKSKIIEAFLLLRKTSDTKNNTRHVIIKPLTNKNLLLIRSTLQNLKRRFHCHNYCILSRDFWKYPLSSTQTLHNRSHLRMSVNTLKKLMSNYRSEGIWVFPRPNRGHWINLNTDQWHHPHYNNIIVILTNCELHVIIQCHNIYKTQ